MAWHSTHDMLPLLPRLPRRADAGDSMAKNQFRLFSLGWRYRKLFKGAWRLFKISFLPVIRRYHAACWEPEFGAPRFFRTSTVLPRRPR